jgi:hypothetical protein
MYWPNRPNSVSRHTRILLSRSPYILFGGRSPIPLSNRLCPHLLRLATHRLPSVEAPTPAQPPPAARSPLPSPPLAPALNAPLWSFAAASAAGTRALGHRSGRPLPAMEDEELEEAPPSIKSKEQTPAARSLSSLRPLGAPLLPFPAASAVGAGPLGHRSRRPLPAIEDEKLEEDLPNIESRRAGAPAR